LQPKGKTEHHPCGHYVTLWRRHGDDGGKIWADTGVPV
jgi:hypothetical protein